MKKELQIKISNKILEQQLSGKTILTLYWLYINQNKENQINCFLPKMMHDLGFDCKGAYSTKNSRELISILNNLVDDEILIKETNDVTYSHDRYGTFSFVQKNNKNCLDALSSNFIICEKREIKTLIDARKNNLVNSSLDNLITIYFYIKSCINNKKNIKIAYPSIEKISYFTGIGKDAVVSVLKDLQKTGLLFKYNVDNYYSSLGIKKHNRVVYSIENYKFNEVKKEFINQTKSF